VRYGICLLELIHSSYGTWPRTAACGIAPERGAPRPVAAGLSMSSSKHIPLRTAESPGVPGPGSGVGRNQGFGVDVWRGAWHQRAATGHIRGVQLSDGGIRAAVERATDRRTCELTSAVSVFPPPCARFHWQALGVDDGKLLIPLILIPTIIFVIYQGFAADQDNEDFFDTYDQRRK